jgi:hypothetical protein
VIAAQVIAALADPAQVIAAQVIAALADPAQVIARPRRRGPGRNRAAPPSPPRAGCIGPRSAAGRLGARALGPSS